MEQVIPKEELNELKKNKGEVRGAGLKSIAEFIFRKEGKEGLKKLEDVMAGLGYPNKYRKIKSMDFYSVESIAVMLLVAKRLFNYTDEDFQEMGGFDAKFSLILRLFMKYLVSIDKAVKEVPKMWKIYFTVGNLKVVEYDKEKKRGILRLEGFHSSLPHCQYLIGYFSTIVQMIVGNKAICEEKKCSFWGDEHHEFLLKW